MSRYSDELHEAVGQVTDLWRSVPEFRFARPHRYPTGVEAIWMFLREPNEAAPEEWLGFPVVVVLTGKRSDTAWDRRVADHITGGLATARDRRP